MGTHRIDRRPPFRSRPPVRRATRAACCRGVSVLEVLVALLLLSLGVIGMAALHARAIQYALDAEDRNRAALLANELSSTMWLNRSTTVASATLTSWQTKVSTVSGNGLPNGSGSVSVDGSGVATITISWRPPSRPSSAGNLQYVTKVVLP